MANVKKTVEKRICVGCGECVARCPGGYITMKVGEFGFPVPEVDEDKCTDCGECVKHCPFSDEYEEDDE